ncbi:MAG TPA: hypothetical protein VF914_04555 [Chloroflexia bacterium]|jgi:predicted small lipoprotein YifL
MTLRNHSQGNIKRAALITTLAATMLVSLAACGGPGTPAATPVATATQTVVMAPVETTLPAELETAVTTAPSAVATESTDMGDMAGMEDEANATQAPADPAGAATSTPATGQGATDGSATQVQGTLREWAIDLSQQEVPAGKVIFTVTNTGQNTHNFAVEDSTGALIAKTPNFGSRDGAQTLELELAPGTYTIICSLPGHAARGQRTQLVVK